MVVLLTSRSYSVYIGDQQEASKTRSLKRFWGDKKALKIDIKPIFSKC
jgi:hypothetical protein